MVHTLDFGILPIESFFDSRPTWTTIPQALELRLAALPQILDRLHGSVMFAELSAKQTEPRRAAAFLRAALAEFCSMEEMQRIDKPSSQHLDLVSLPNPLLHLLELLRHLNIHVKAVQVAPHSVVAAFDGEAFPINVFVVPDLRAADLAALKNGKRYSSSDLQAMVAWFEEAQLHWGAGYIVKVGAESLGEAICKHYGY